jgi:hypothetical protein
MSEYEFNKDLEYGELGEKIIQNKLETKGYKFVSDNKNYKYDLEMLSPNGNTVKFEIKTDVWCIPDRMFKFNGKNIKIAGRDNGNMFIEYQSRGKKSGINTTLADVFIMYYPYYNKMWSIKIDDLIRLIEINDFKETVESGDENSNTKGYLIPREKFKSHFYINKINYKWE